MKVWTFTFQHPTADNGCAKQNDATDCFAPTNRVVGADRQLCSSVNRVLSISTSGDTSFAVQLTVQAVTIGGYVLQIWNSHVILRHSLSLHISVWCAVVESTDCLYQCQYHRGVLRLSISRKLAFHTVLNKQPYKNVSNVYLLLV